MAGEAAYARGDYEAAARAFEVSNRLARTPNAMYNAGLAWEAGGQPARAADALDNAIASGGLTEAQLADAQPRLTRLQTIVGRVRIQAAAGTQLWLAHAERLEAPVTVHAAAGRHVLKVLHPDGSSESRDVDVSAGAETAITINAPIPAPPKPPAPVTGPQPEPIAPDEGGVDGLWITGWVLTGVGVAAGAVAIGVGVAALGARDDFEASGRTDVAAHDDAATLRTVTNIAWLGAGVCTIAGVVMLIVSATGEESETARFTRDGFVLRF